MRWQELRSWELKISEQLFLGFDGSAIAFFETVILTG
jgi:hypothetical protein